MALIAPVPGHCLPHNFTALKGNLFHHIISHGVARLNSHTINCTYAKV